MQRPDFTKRLPAESLMPFDGLHLVLGQSQPRQPQKKEDCHFQMPLLAGVTAPYWHLYAVHKLSWHGSKSIRVPPAKARFSVEKADMGKKRISWEKRSV